MNPQKLLIPSFFIVISLADMITTVIGINHFGLIESNINAFPLAYGFLTFCLWIILDKVLIFVDNIILFNEGNFIKIIHFKIFLFFILCLLSSLPFIGNLVLLFV